NARMRMPAQGCAGQLRQQNFRCRRGGAHELAAVELHEVIAAVLVQREPRPIGRDRFSESAKGLHSTLASVTLKSRTARSSFRGANARRTRGDKQSAYEPSHNIPFRVRLIP